MRVFATCRGPPAGGAAAAPCARAHCAAASRCRNYTRAAAVPAGGVVPAAAAVAAARRRVLVCATAAGTHRHPPQPQPPGQPRASGGGVEPSHRLERALAAAEEGRREQQRREDAVAAAARDLAVAYIRLQSEAQGLRKELDAVSRERARLQRALEEAEDERTCATQRANEQVEAAEQRAMELEQQLHAAAHREQQLHAFAERQQQLLLAAQRQQTEQQQQEEEAVTRPERLPERSAADSSGCESTSNASGDDDGVAGVGDAFAHATDGTLPAQPPLPDAPPLQGLLLQPCVPLPPLLPLDPAALLPGADLELGLTRADIELRVHQFATCLHHAVDRRELLDGPAASLVHAVESWALPYDAVARVPSESLVPERPAFLGHMLMHWLSTSVWEDPLSYVRCGVRLGCSGVPLSPAELNTALLLNSHAARRWEPCLRGAVESATAAEHRGDPKAWQAALQQDQRPAAQAVAAAVAQATHDLALWLRTYPPLAAAVQADPWFPGLLLRALHLGVMVRAAHPLLALHVTTPTVQLVHLPASQRRPAELDLLSQHVRRRVDLPAGGPWSMGLRKPHVLSSVQPGVQYDRRLAGDRLHERDRCFLREEVVAWATVGPC